MIAYDSLPESPVGPLWVATSATGLVNVHIGGDEAAFVRQVKKHTGREPLRDPEAVAPARQELQEYLHGRRQKFTIPLDWSLITGYQRDVLDLVFQIPYGRVRTYGDIARQLGNIGASRAVGRANATNPLPLVIPCHRVLGSDGKLHGYGGGNGIETKAWLLRLEGSRLL